MLTAGEGGGQYQNLKKVGGGGTPPAPLSSAYASDFHLHMIGLCKSTDLCIPLPTQYMNFLNLHYFS